MANRSVNITINYKVNTAEVVRAQNTARLAQKATDDLRKSTEQYGKASTTAHRQAQSAARDTNGSINQLYSSVRLLIAAGLAREIAQVSIEMAKLGGNTEAVTRAFNNQIPKAQRLLIELRKATLGTVNDLQLMQRTLRAHNFGIAVERLPKLLQFAQIRAQQTGETVDYLVNSIVDGLGRKSLLKLDNLGISASRLREEFKGASLQSLSVAQVTEGVANIVEEELHKMGAAVENGATEVDRMNVAWHEFKTELSDSAFWDAVVSNLKGMAEASRDVIRSIKGESLQERWRKEQQQAIATATVSEYTSRIVKKSKEEQIQLIEDEIQRMTEKVGTTLRERDAAVKTIEWINEMAVSGKGLAHAVVQQTDAQRKFISVKMQDALQDQEIIKLLQEKLVALKEENKEETVSIGIIKQKRAEIDRLKEQIEDTNRRGDLGENGLLVIQLRKEQDELDRLLGKSDKDAKKKEDDAARRKRENDKRSFEHWKYYDDLKRKKAAETEEELTRIMEDEARRRAEIAEEEARKREDQQILILSLAEDFLRSSVDLATTESDSRIDQIQRYYDEQMAFAEGNERLQSELRIKRERELDAERERQKQAEKKNAEARILIDGLVAIAKIFAEFGWPLGIAPAAIMAGITATNVAQVRKYAKGEVNIDGPGTSTSDSIPAMLSKGESVINAEATRRSMGLLEAIQANKIDDRIMKSIDFSGGRMALNDQRMVSELRSLKSELRRLKQPDLIYQNGIAYKVYTDADNNRRKIRASVMKK